MLLSMFKFSSEIMNTFEDIFFSEYLNVVEKLPLPFRIKQNFINS